MGPFIYQLQLDPEHGLVHFTSKFTTPRPPFFTATTLNCSILLKLWTVLYTILTHQVPLPPTLCQKQK